MEILCFIKDYTQNRRKKARFVNFSLSFKHLNYKNTQMTILKFNVYQNRLNAYNLKD